MSEEKKLESMECLDELLKSVTGGADKQNVMPIMCSCGSINKVDVNKSSFKCCKCGKVSYIQG